MRQNLTFLSLFSVLLAACVQAETQAQVPNRVEEFIKEEIDKPKASVKRSNPAHPTGKPDKISVTIYKEYKVRTPDGRTEYVSVKEDDQGFLGAMDPPLPGLLQQMPLRIPGPGDYKIEKAKDLSDEFHLSLPQPQSPSSQVQTSSPAATAIFNAFMKEAPKSLSPVPLLYKRKTMDGWLPLYSGSYIGPNNNGGLVQQYKNFYAQRDYSKGAYFSPYKHGSMQASASTVSQQQVRPPSSSSDFLIQKAVHHPQLHSFTQGDVVVEGGKSPVYTKKETEQDPKNIVIHTQNIIIKSDEEGKTGPNISLIKAYGSTPQISAVLRERLRASQQGIQSHFPHPLDGKPFPSGGGVSLRSLAAAIRNGAFSLDNDVVPSMTGNKEVEINIPHRFKMAKKPKVDGGYSTVKVQTQVASASDSSPSTAYGAPSTGYGAPSQQGGYGGPPRVGPVGGIRDYGDGVKYASKTPIEIVNAYPSGSADTEYGLPTTGGNSLNQLAQELEQKLKVLVQQEVINQVMMQQKQTGYGPPQETKAQEYGAPAAAPAAAIGTHYGAPSASSSDSDSYGPPSTEYGAPGGYDTSHLSPPPEEGGKGGKPGKPFSLDLNFDTGFWGHPSASVDVETGSAPSSEGVEGIDAAHITSEVKDKLFSIGKNLFYSAVDFSRKYNPITFLEHVQKFPPVQFEVYDSPKVTRGKGKGKGKGGWSRRRNDSKRRHH